MPNGSDNKLLHTRTKKSEQIREQRGGSIREGTEVRYCGQHAQKHQCTNKARSKPGDPYLRLSNKRKYCLPRVRSRTLEITAHTSLLSPSYAKSLFLSSTHVETHVTLRNVVIIDSSARILESSTIRVRPCVCSPLTSLASVC